jgi:hypothetical protein
MGKDVKYYIYLSDAKLDMLYPQIPKSLLKRIASELNINLKLLGAELTAGIKGEQSEETRYSKVRMVSKYIDENLHLGTVDSPGAYFKGTLPMKWGLLPGDNFYTNTSETGVVYFGGFSDQTIVGLGGAAHHMIGNDKGLTQGAFSYSQLPYLLEALGFESVVRNEYLSEWEADRRKWGEKEVEEWHDSGALAVVQATTEKMRGPEQRLEFLAKTLLQGPLRNLISSKTGKPLRYKQNYVVLGTPIYVALAG